MLVEEDRAFVWFQDAKNQTQNRGLSGAALTDNDQALLRSDNQGNIVEHLFAPEAHYNIPQLDDVSGRGCWRLSHK